jgi:hypothetical protein
MILSITRYIWELATISGLKRLLRTRYSFDLRTIVRWRFGGISGIFWWRILRSRRLMTAETAGTAEDQKLWPRIRRIRRIGAIRYQAGRSAGTHSILCNNGGRAPCLLVFNKSMENFGLFTLHNPGAGAIRSIRLIRGQSC